jgi:hypothetical protein
MERIGRGAISVVSGVQPATAANRGKARRKADVRMRHHLIGKSDMLPLTTLIDA